MIHGRAMDEPVPSGRYKGEVPDKEKFNIEVCRERG